MFRAFLIGLVLLAAACGRQEEAVQFHTEGYPETLSAWNILNVKDANVQLTGNTHPYDLASPLFSDYALKFRTLTLPEGTATTYSPDATFSFPVGTIISKTFYYRSSTPRIVESANDAPFSNGRLDISGYRLIETRILARREEGWVAFPYVWNEDQTEAKLKRVGKVIPLTYLYSNGQNNGASSSEDNTTDFAYLVPNQNQCAGCHATDNTSRTIEPIGLKARHLNKASTYAPAFNQLDYWQVTGILEGDFRDAHNAPRNVRWDDILTPLDDRARAYLDINCSHCHNPVGPADTSGLNLEPDAAGPSSGVCKNPIAAGSGSGGHQFDIVPGHPEQSIFIYRMESTDPGAMMPELGRALVHKEGVSLIREWITSLEGDCII